jgi:hypothetical protein
MIKAILEETLKKMSGKLFSLGLPDFHQKDAALLAESTFLQVFRYDIIKGKVEKLLGILTSKRTSEKTDIIQKVVLALSKKSIERRVVDNYKAELINKLQMNTEAASLVSRAAIPEMMRSLVERFSKEGVCKNTLAKIVDEGLPLHPHINFKFIHH